MFFKSSKTPSSDERPSVAPVAATSIQAEPVADNAKLNCGAARSKMRQASFGEVVTLMMHSPKFAAMPLLGLRELVVPALEAGQFLVVEGRNNETGHIAPAAAVLWAYVSEDVDRRLSEGEGKQFALSPKDWTGGDIPWVIITVGDDCFFKSLYQTLQQRIFKGRPFKSISIGAPRKQPAHGNAPRIN